VIIERYIAEDCFFGGADQNINFLVLPDSFIKQFNLLKCQYLSAIKTNFDMFSGNMGNWQIKILLPHT